MSEHLDSGSKQGYQLSDLLYLMARLRKPVTGCPWDLKQNYKSITASTIEEAYEVVDAIESEDYVHLKEELGDLLFQVVFYCQLAKEEGRFSFPEVVDVLTRKLIRRHPHVFPAGSLESEISDKHVHSEDVEAVKKSWEAIKQDERNEKGSQSLLDDVPKALPALSRAQKLQKRASNAGFDWSAALDVLPIIREELEELEQAISEQSNDAIKEELGDVIFSLVNLSRKLKQDPEAALRMANTKFEKRFRYIEEQLRNDNLEPSSRNLELMEKYWQQAKINL